MKYREMLEKLWKEREKTQYDIHNTEDNMGFRFTYGFMGEVCFEKSVVYYENNHSSISYSLSLCLLESDKWQLLNPRPLDKDDFFNGVNAVVCPKCGHFGMNMADCNGWEWLICPTCEEDIVLKEGSKNETD